MIGGGPGQLRIKWPRSFYRDLSDKKLPCKDGGKREPEGKCVSRCQASMAPKPASTEEQEVTYRGETISLGHWRSW